MMTAMTGRVKRESDDDNNDRKSQTRKRERERGLSHLLHSADVPLPELGTQVLTLRGGQPGIKSSQAPQSHDLLAQAGCCMLGSAGRTVVAAAHVHTVVVVGGGLCHKPPDQNLQGRKME